MNKNNLTEEQLCKFCYNLCVKCNWDNNKIWREAKRNNMITNDIKYNAKVYMEKYLKISKEEIYKKNEFLIPYKFKQMLITYKYIIQILINENTISINEINNSDWIQKHLKLYINYFCYQQCINTNWDKSKIKKIAENLNISIDVLIKNAKMYAIGVLNWSEKEWSTQINLQGQKDPNKYISKNKYTESFNTILALDKEELTKFLEKNENNINSMRATLHSFIISYHNDNYDEIKNIITTKLNNYTREKSQQRKKEKEKRQINQISSIISNFIKSNESLENYLKKEQINTEKFNKMLSILKDKNKNLYNRYLYKLDELQQNETIELKNTLTELINQLTINKNFNILDYYLMTKHDIKKLKSIANKQLNDQELKLFYIFCNQNKVKELMSKQDIKDLLTTKTIIGTKFDKNNNPIPNTGREITKEEILQIIKYLEDNNIPLYPKIYKIALLKYINNELDIYNKKEKRKVLIK